MQSLSKAVLLGSLMFSVCTLADAASKKMPQSLFAPHLKSEGITVVHTASSQMLYLRTESLIPHTVRQPVKNKTCASSKKKNELYELSAIFNDKLQLFLSYFDDQQTYQVAERSENIDDLSVNNNVRID